jgi:hypothetical protein
MSRSVIRWSRRGLYLVLIWTFLWDDLYDWVCYFSVLTHTRFNAASVTTFLVAPALGAIVIFFDQVIVLLFKLSLIWLALAIWYAFSHGYCGGPGVLDGIASCGMFIARESLDFAAYNIHCFITDVVRWMFHLPPPEIIKTHLEGFKVAASLAAIHLTPQAPGAKPRSCSSASAASSSDSSGCSAHR